MIRMGERLKQNQLFALCLYITITKTHASPIPVTSSVEDANPFVAACTLVIAFAPSVVASTVSPSVFEKLVYFNAFSAISFDTLEFLNILFISSIFSTPSINEATACALPSISKVLSIELIPLIISLYFPISFNDYMCYNSIIN